MACKTRKLNPNKNSPKTTTIKKKRVKVTREVKAATFQTENPNPSLVKEVKTEFTEWLGPRQCQLNESNPIPLDAHDWVQDPLTCRAEASSPIPLAYIQLE